MVKTLISTSFDDATQTLTLNFSDNLSAIEAGKPYIVKWPAQSPNYLENPVFTGVVISNDPANVETDYIDFVGTYSSVVFDAGTAHKDVLFLGGGSTLYYPDGQNATTIGACRAYFTLNGITAGDPTNGVRQFVLNFGDDETGISEKVIVKSEKFATAAGWYTLDGRKLDGRPTKKGLYIHGGRTVVIK